MVDGSTGTTASFFGATNDTQLCNTNTCPGTDLGTITKVEIRAYGQEAQTGNVSLYLQPVFSGGNGDTHDLLPDFSFGSNVWSQWFDITSDTNAPGTWSWSDVQNLDMTVYGEQNESGPGSVQRIGKIDIRVTYS